MSIVKKPVPGDPNDDYHIYDSSHQKYCVICKRKNPISLLFYTISLDRDLLIHEFSFNSPSPRHLITGFIWHPNNPCIFFTHTNRITITCHRIIHAEKRVENIGTTDIEDVIFLFTPNSTGTKMVIVLDDEETAMLFILDENEDGTISFVCVHFTIFDECEIRCIDFLDDDIIIYGYTDGTIHIEQNREYRRNTDIVQTNGEIVAVCFSPNGHFLAVAATNGFSIYIFDKERFVFHLLAKFVDKNYFCSKVTLEWHDSLPLLVCAFVKRFAGINGTSKIMSFCVTNFGVEQLHFQKIKYASICGIFIHPILPFAIFSYYGVTKGQVLVWNFQNSVRFPLERLLLMRNFLYQQNLPEDDMIDKILQEVFGMHLSWQRFKHNCRIPVKLPQQLLQLPQPPSKDFLQD
jgi:WD40 repeat protein